jgi:single-stranded-DNA-specific exonuclease
MLPRNKWKVLNTDSSKSLISVILENRNLNTAHLEKFKLSDRLHDPFLLKNMQKATERIMKAVQSKETIAIYGDYDVDGVVATVLMVKLFERLNYAVQYFLPNREKDGYGLRPSGIAYAIEKKVDLLITVDNGISSQQAIDVANKNGIDVIITDHHLPEGDLPRAYAIINPNQSDCSYPFKGICGAGVVYKIMHAIGSQLYSEEEFSNLMLSQLDLVTLATIADMAPIRDENYALIKFGLKSLTQTMRPGIVELKRVSGLLGKAITPTAVGYYLGPRLNAAGRLADASLAAQLLLSKSREEAAGYAHELNALNSERQRRQEEYITKALDDLQKEQRKVNKVHIVESEEWDLGLLGIISGRLKDRFCRPVIAFTRDSDGNYVGSARSLDNFNITHALTKFNTLLSNYGGHEKAAGLTIPEDNYQRFKKEFIAYVNETLDEEEMVPELVIDTIVNTDQLNESIVHTIQEIGPFGESNPEPLLLIEQVRIKDIIPLSQGKHLKFVVQKGGRHMECVWWGSGIYKDEVRFNEEMDLVFKPSINLWDGREKLQLVIEDLKYSDCQT